MENRTEIKNKIEEITNKYCVKLVGITFDGGIVDIRLDHNIYYKEQEKMINEIREIANLNDVEYLDVAY